MFSREYILRDGLLAIRCRLVRFDEHGDGTRVAWVRVLEGELTGRIVPVNPLLLREDSFELAPVG
nr:hypothetical protein [uncultured Rhodopila sp.]